MNKLPSLKKAIIATKILLITGIFSVAMLVAPTTGAYAANGSSITVYPQDWTIENGPIVAVTDGGMSVLRLTSSAGNKPKMYSEKVKQFQYSHTGEKVRVCTKKRSNGVAGSLTTVAFGVDKGWVDTSTSKRYHENCFTSHIMSEQALNDGESLSGQVLIEASAKNKKLTRKDFVRYVRYTIIK